MSKKMEDLTSLRFGKLTVVRFLGKRYDGHYMWLCLCDCGTRKTITRNRLMSSECPSRSCGCLQKEVASRVSRKHGYSSEMIYKIWTAMKQRCMNPKNPEYKNYGSRGITVCDRWMKFEAFLEDMGNPPERGMNGLYLDRTDNDRGYYKENCRWTSIKTQLLNRRNTKMLTVDGVTKPLKIWCDEKGILYVTALHRMRAGKSGRDVLIPVKYRKPRNGSHHT